MKLKDIGCYKSLSQIQTSAGCTALNHQSIETSKGRLLVSYGVNVAFIPHDSYKKTVLDYKWNYSRTTWRYLSNFLDENMESARKKITSGEYELDNLNDLQGVDYEIF